MASPLHRYRVLAVFGVITLSLAACASDQKRTRAEGTAAGAAAGAALGRAITGDDRGTLIGAVLGGIVGVVVGNRMADKKAAYAQREETLRLSAQRASALAESTRASNDTVEREIAELDLAVAQLRTAKASSAKRREAAAAQQQRLATITATVEEQLTRARSEVEQQNKLIAEVRANDVAQKRVAAQQEQQESEGFRLVAASLRDLEQQTRRLELARLQLQQIDARRAY